MVELFALTLSLLSSLLSEAEEIYPKEVLLGLGGRRCFRPRHRIFYAALGRRTRTFSSPWVTPEGRPPLPPDLPAEWRRAIEVLVDRVGRRSTPKIYRLQPHGWDEFNEDGESLNVHADADDMRNLLFLAGVKGGVVWDSEFLEVSDDLGYHLKIEGWCAACVDSGFGPWSPFRKEGERWEPRYDQPGLPTTPSAREQRFLAFCVAESEVRACVVKPGEIDGPPGGAVEWLLDLWVGSADPSGTYDLVQIQLWRTRA